MEMLRNTRELYNAALQERRDAWSMRRISIQKKMQSRELTEIRASDPTFAAVNRECQDAVLHRIDLAFAAFFRRVRDGSGAGYPRFKPAHRWNQLEFAHGDTALKLDPLQRRVYVPGAGRIRLRKGRQVPANFGRAFIVLKNQRWYCIFEAHRFPIALPKTGISVGIDRGIRRLATMSDGTIIANIESAKASNAIVKRHSRELELATERDSAGRVLNRRSPSRAAAAQRFARAIERTANQRRDWLHKASRRIVNSYDLIALEQLHLAPMTRRARGLGGAPAIHVAAKSGLNRALLDAAFGTLEKLIREKAENAARVVLSVDARYTSQTCSLCGYVSSSNRKRTRFSCVSCGAQTDADVNAARVILQRAESPPMRAMGYGSRFAAKRSTAPTTNATLARAITPAP
jgi:putative transposase